MKRPFPPFVTDTLALQILVELGGSASRVQIVQYLEENYTRPEKHAMQYLFAQYRGLMRAGYIDQTCDMRTRNSSITYSIRNEVKHLLKVPQVASVRKSR